MPGIEDLIPAVMGAPGGFELRGDSRLGEVRRSCEAVRRLLCGPGEM